MEQCGYGLGLESLGVWCYESN